MHRLLARAHIAAVAPLLAVLAAPALASGLSVGGTTSLPTTSVSLPAISTPVKAPPVKLPPVRIPPVTVTTPTVKAPPPPPAPKVAPPSKVPIKPVPISAPPVLAGPKTPSNHKTPVASAPVIKPGAKVPAPTGLPSVKTPPVGLPRTTGAPVSAPTAAGVPTATGKRLRSVPRSVAPGTRSAASSSPVAPSGATASGSAAAAQTREGSAYSTSPPPAIGGRHPTVSRAAAAESRRVMATVQRLRGCLGALPARVRLVLELRSGVSASHALSVAEAADYLNVGARRIAGLERRGLRLLRARAHTQRCETSATAVIMSAPVYSSAVPAELAAIANESSGGTAAGGVQGFNATRSPLGAAGASERQLIEAAARPAADRPIVIALAILAGMLALALVTADSLGLGPRHAPWRGRLRARFARRR